MISEFVLLAVREEDHLIQDICHCLGKEPGVVKWTYFADNTFAPEILTNIRRKDVYIVLTLDKYPSDVLEKCYELIDAAKRARPKSITLVMPEHPGQRQDKRHGKRESISVARHANVFKALSADHTICIDLHAPQIEGLYSSLDNLKGAPIFADHLKKTIDVKELHNLVMVSPDAGGMRDTTFLSKHFEPTPEVAFIQKERTGTNESTTGKVVGEVKDKTAVIYDDILDTGGTMLKAASAVRAAGAKKIIVCISHALLNEKKREGKAIGADIAEKMHLSVVDEFIFLNTRNKSMEVLTKHPELKEKLTILDISPYLAEAIRRDQIGETIREMVEIAGVENLYKVEHKANNL